MPEIKLKWNVNGVTEERADCGNIDTMAIWESLETDWGNQCRWVNLSK